MVPIAATTTGYRKPVIPARALDFVLMAIIGLCIALLTTGNSAAQNTTLSTVLNAAAQDKAAGWAGTEISSSLGIELQKSDGRDGEEIDRDTGRFRTDLKLALRQPLGEAARFQAQLELRAEYLTNREARDMPDSSQTSYELERFYFQRYHSGKIIRWRFGRQEIDDLTGSAVDEVLDGIRVTVESETLQLDLSYTRQDWIQASTDDRSDEIYNTLAQLTFRPTRSTRWMPYLLHRDERDLVSGDDLSTATWLGIQGTVKLSPDWRYWLDAAMRDGKHIENNENLGGFEANIGLTWIRKGRFKPTYSIGFAHASNDYRQSGLHSNDFRANGYSRFRYLGEVLDPELANLQVLTLGIGAQSGKRWSGDFALHTYQQVKLENNIRGSDLAFEPDGNSKDLGWGLDVIVAWQRSDQLEFQAKAGILEPGSAFSNDAGTAWISALEVEYEF